MQTYSSNAAGSAGGPARNSGTDPALAISRRLKAYYDSVQEEAIPDRFLDLLEQLDNAERKASEMEKSGK